MSVRPRATVSPFVPSKRVRRMPSRPRRKNPIYKSMSGPSVHVLTKICNITQPIGTTGITPLTGVVSSFFFSLWFTNQSAFIWINSANYSTVSVPGYSDLAALFDEVKIAAIEIELITGNDPTTGTTGSGVIVMATDYNDKAAPASAADVQQYSDCKSIRLTNNFAHREILRPKFLTYSLDSAGAAIASTPKQGFVRSNLDIEHFGKKCAFILAPPNVQHVVFSFKYKYICKIQK